MQFSAISGRHKQAGYRGYKKCTHLCSNAILLYETKCDHCITFSTRELNCVVCPITWKTWNGPIRLRSEGPLSKRSATLGDTDLTLRANSSKSIKGTIASTVDCARGNQLGPIYAVVASALTDCSVLKRSHILYLANVGSANVGQHK